MPCVARTFLFPSRGSDRTACFYVFNISMYVIFPKWVYSRENLLTRRYEILWNYILFGGEFIRVGEHGRGEGEEVGGAPGGGV